VVSVRYWEGEYYSWDLPGGVESTPVRSELRLVSLGGGNEAVGLNETRAEHPQASPDGRWIYWQTETAGRWRIIRMRPDGSKQTVVAPARILGERWRSAFGAQLSRDGGAMTYTVSDGETGRAVRARADGTDAAMIASDFGYTYMASPDEDASRVVFSGPARGYRLAIIHRDETTPRIITPNHPDAYAPQFTPDGRAIVFIRRDGGLYRVAPDGTDLRRLVDNVQVEFFLSPEDRHGSTDEPAISPDGKRVAFIAHRDGKPPQVAVIDVDGKNFRRLTELAGRCARVIWSPDGTWLAFVSMVEKTPQLFLMPPDGSAPPRRLTSDGGAVYALCWLPKGGEPFQS